MGSQGFVLAQGFDSHTRTVQARIPAKLSEDVRKHHQTHRRAQKLPTNATLQGFDLHLFVTPSGQRLKAACFDLQKAQMQRRPHRTLAIMQVQATLQTPDHPSQAHKHRLLNSSYSHRLKNAFPRNTVCAAFHPLGPRPSCQALPRHSPASRHPFKLARSAPTKPIRCWYAAWSRSLGHGEIWRTHQNSAYRLHDNAVRPWPTVVVVVVVVVAAVVVVVVVVAAEVVTVVVVVCES